MFRTEDRRLFYYWINERHRIYNKRKAGLPKPWTQDKILQEYKFTNCFRELDRGTLWMRENLTGPNKHKPNDIQLFNCGVYRYFNWYKTAEIVGFIDEWDPSILIQKLERRIAEGQKTFTSAHIIRGVSGYSKVTGVCKIMDWLWEAKGRITYVAKNTQSLEKTFDELIKIPYIGGFMGYEIASDLRWIPLLENATDKTTWANIGPGAERGLLRLGLPHTPSNQLNSLRVLYEEHDKYIESHVKNSGLPFEMREIEHSLCEFDKYCRVLRGEGRPRSKFAG